MPARISFVRDMYMISIVQNIGKIFLGKPGIIIKWKVNPMSSCVS